MPRLLSYTRGACATRKIDQVRALLNITESIELSGKETTREAYMKMSLALLKGNPDLILLSIVQESNRALRLPSWAPDWSVP